MKEVFYELRHDVGADYFTVEEAENFSFSMHMHRCYEMVLMLDGELWIGRNEYGIGLPHFYADTLADVLNQPKG